MTYLVVGYYIRGVVQPKDIRKRKCHATRIFSAQKLNNNTLFLSDKTDIF
jgi:hypothetical protein